MALHSSMLQKNNISEYFKRIGLTLFTHELHISVFRSLVWLEFLCSKNCMAELPAIDDQHFKNFNYMFFRVAASVVMATDDARARLFFSYEENLVMFYGTNYEGVAVSFRKGSRIGCLTHCHVFLCPNCSYVISNKGMQPGDKEIKQLVGSPG